MTNVGPYSQFCSRRFSCDGEAERAISKLYIVVNIGGTISRRSGYINRHLISGASAIEYLQISTDDSLTFKYSTLLSLEIIKQIAFIIRDRRPAVLYVDMA